MSRLYVPPVRAADYHRAPSLILRTWSPVPRASGLLYSRNRASKTSSGLELLRGGVQATVLMIEAEPLEGLSVRKLVLETERYNLITAYNAAEGLRLSRDFMNVDAVIIRANVQGSNCDEVAGQIKMLRPDIP